MYNEDYRARAWLTCLAKVLVPTVNRKCTLLTIAETPLRDSDHLHQKSPAGSLPQKIGFATSRSSSAAHVGVGPDSTGEMIAEEDQTLPSPMAEAALCATGVHGKFFEIHTPYVNPALHVASR
ncbi:hypothetical protein PGT21_014614 [Puccinia graminis f. sp. tritici]|uniref:Uncharacterized protein n=1 Tax=Puccinia graminis f. sp. tritici TaxID=56615 RepID=A0A5B0LRR1_PUCGR|nr:hypothetical protein PGT21_014614 [Puccinia graminis f. sp. tritici]